jgi:hypothetical protein
MDFWDVALGWTEQGCWRGKLRIDDCGKLGCTEGDSVGRWPEQLEIC